MPQSMAHSQVGPVEYRFVGGGYETDLQIGSLLTGRKSTVLLFETQADLGMGQALFVNSFPLSLAVRLNSLLLPAELGAGWKSPANGPAGPTGSPAYPAQPIKDPTNAGGTDLLSPRHQPSPCRRRSAREILVGRCCTCSRPDVALGKKSRRCN